MRPSGPWRSNSKSCGVSLALLIRPRAPLANSTMMVEPRVVLRVPAPLAVVHQPVLLEAALVGGDHPHRLRVGEVADRVHEVGAVAEQHRPPAPHVGEDAGQGADGAVAHGLPRLLVAGDPAAGVVDGDAGAVGLHRGDHAVGILQGGGQGLLAEDPPDAGLRGAADGVGVEVIGGGDADHVEVFPLQHEAVVGVLADAARGDPGPLVEARQDPGVDVAYRGQVVPRRAGIGPGVGAAEAAADDRGAQGVAAHLRRLRRRAWRRPPCGSRRCWRRRGSRCGRRRRGRARRSGRGCRS